VNRPTLAELGARPDGAVEQRLPCPRCAAPFVDDALAVNIETGAFHCFRCQWSGRATATAASGRPLSRIEEALGSMRKIWSATAALDANTAGAKAARVYLESRGLGAVLRKPPASLRASSGLSYLDEERRQVGVFPALVAVVTESGGNPVTLHRTYLRPDGTDLAPVPRPRLMLLAPITERRAVARAARGIAAGCAVRLFPATRVLGIAGSIENALALAVTRGIPAWAAVAGSDPDDPRPLSAFFLPPVVREIHVAVEASESSRTGARWLLERLLGWRDPPRVILVEPRAGAVDLCDELVRR